MSTGSAEIKSAKESAFLDKEKAVFLLSAALGLILSFAFVKYSISASDSALGIASLGNIKTYILAVLVWLAGSCAAFPILTKFLPSKDNKVFGWVILAAAGTFFLYAGFEIYQFVGKGWNPKYLLTCIVFAAGTIVVSQLCKKLPWEKAQNVILVLEVLGFATLWFLSACYLNTFTNWSFGTMYNVFHSSSYIDSIANVFFGHPYRGLECDLYGHYGLFFILPLKIFGGATKTIGIIMGLLAAITFIAFALSVMLSGGSRLKRNSCGKYLLAELSSQDDIPGSYNAGSYVVRQEEGFQESIFHRTYTSCLRRYLELRIWSSLCGRMGNIRSKSILPRQEQDLVRNTCRVHQRRRILPWSITGT